MPHVVVVRIEANFVRNFLRQKSANEATARDAPAHDKRVLTPDTVLRLCRNREVRTRQQRDAQEMDRHTLAVLSTQYNLLRYVDCVSRASLYG